MISPVALAPPLSTLDSPLSPLDSLKFGAWNLFGICDLRFEIWNFPPSMSTTELINESPATATSPPATDRDLPVVVDSPESPLSEPDKLVRDIAADFWKSRELIWILFMRDLKAQFRQSYFGYVWLFAAPDDHRGLAVFE